MHKDKRIDNEAVLEVVGRDQQEQKLHLTFDRQQLIWELDSMETELWIEPPDPVLEVISKIVSEEDSVWKGTASELLEKLPEINLKPNVLTRKLNVSVGRLLDEYSIRYENSRNHNGRIITLTLEK